MDGGGYKEEEPFSEDGNEPDNSESEIKNTDNDTDTSKKEIQKLSGELSQKLNTYNSSQQTPDSDLNKYVAGMIIKQASKGLDDEDKDDIINKIESNSDDEKDTIPNDNEDAPESDGEVENQMESRIPEVKKLVDEIMNNILSTDKEDNNEKYEKKITNRHVSNNSPFVYNPR